ncbi:MAG TPA: ABC transporter ATP-binding protein [Candidatus Deferrimicrobium sp.]|nr:ABC transporter ATP-binding protein [Candidatus Deferrimicrobium sp.]
MSNNRQTRRYTTLVKYLKRERRYLALGGMAVILTNALGLIIPYLTKLVFDLLENGGSSSAILRLVLLSIGLAVLAGVFRFFTRRTIIWASRRIEYDLRGDLFAHLLTLSPSYYHQNRTGDIMARATNDLEAVRMMMGPGIMHISNTIVSAVIAISFMIYLSPKLTLYALTPMVLFPVVVNRLGNLVHKRFLKIQQHFSELTAAAQENIAGMRVVKAYRQEDAEISFFSKMSQKYITLNMDMARLNGVLFPLIMFLASALNLTVLYFGGLDVIDGRIPFGTLVAFFAYLAMLFWPAFALGWVISLYQRGMASLDRINEVLFTEPIVKNTGDNLRSATMRGKIEFRDLRFSYNGRPVLDGINLVIEAGRTVGIVGMTASGKTTLASLLPRLYPVPRDKLFIDDIDINDWELSALRRQIGFVTQEPFLFSETVAENIHFGHATTKTEAVDAAAETAALAKDVQAFPHGFDTLVGERGITLSGGQKQRTAIARALLIEPAILILDDATSSVDTETEHEINERVRAASRRCTSIIISHRVSAVKEADSILFLQDGRIAEQGTHDELLALDGNYAELYRSQLLALELERIS